VKVIIRSFLSKLIGFLIHPIETFRVVKELKGAEAIAYYLSLLVFNAIISAIITVLIVTDKLPFVTPFLAGTVVVVLGLLGLLLAGLVLHVAVVLLGGQRSIIRTLIVLSYSLTPFLLTSWLLIIFSGFGAFGIYGDSISFLYVIGIGLYTLLLVTIGLRELQGISNTRAFLAAGTTAFVVVIGVLLIAILVFVMSWGIGYSQLVPYFFNMERNGEMLTIKNSGGKGLADIAEIRVTVNDVPSGRIGIARGSIVTVNAPSCPSDVKIIGVFENGISREIWTPSDDECPNTLANITVVKIGDMVTVRNNGGPGLDRVAALNVQIYNGAPYPLGLTPGDQVTIEDRSCSTLVVVNATLKSGAFWQLVHEYQTNCTALKN